MYDSSIQPLFYGVTKQEEFYEDVVVLCMMSNPGIDPTTTRYLISVWKTRRYSSTPGLCEMIESNPYNINLKPSYTFVLDSGDLDVDYKGICKRILTHETPSTDYKFDFFMNWSFKGKESRQKYMDTVLWRIKQSSVEKQQVISENPHVKQRRKKR